MIGDGPAPRARTALAEDPAQPDDYLAGLSASTPEIVARCRAELEGLGAIPVLSNDPGPAIVRGKAGADLCRAALRDDATRSNAEIAESEGVTTAQVAAVRRALENLGVIATRPGSPCRWPGVSR